MDKVIEALTNNSPLALIIIGLILFVISASSKLPYFDTPIEDQGWRIALAVMGGVVASLGGLLLWRENEQEAVTRVKRYEIKITSHRNGELVDDRFTLQGSFKKKPSGKAAVLEVSERNHYYFKRYLHFDDDTKEWSALVKLEESHAQRKFAIYVLGGAGQALVDYSLKVRERYGTRPSIDILTPDARKCAEVNLVRKQSPKKTA